MRADTPHSKSPAIPSRRGFLKGLGIGAGAAATVGGVALALPESGPDHRDMCRYYAFLWNEMKAVAEEMGVPMFDHQTACQYRDGQALRDALTGAPSTRALSVLRAANADTGAVPSEPDPRWFN